MLMPNDRRAWVEQHGELFSLNADLYLSTLDGRLLILYTTFGVDHSLQVIVIFPKHVIASADLMQTIFHILFTQTDHPHLIVPEAIDSLRKNRVVCRHHLFAEDLQIASLLPPIVPELGHIFLFTEGLLPKLEVWHNFPIENMVAIENPPRRIDSCQYHQTIAIIFTTSIINLRIVLKVLIDSRIHIFFTQFLNILPIIKLI